MSSSSFKSSSFGLFGALYCDTFGKLKSKIGRFSNGFHMESNKNFVFYMDVLVEMVEKEIRNAKITFEPPLKTHPSSCGRASIYLTLSFVAIVALN